MERKIFLLFITLALSLSSCESDSLTSQSVLVPGKLILNPSHLEGEQYDTYEFRAKVVNVPFSDVIFEWDFDEGEGFQVHSEQIVTRIFYQARMHTVRVRATDYYSSQVLGHDSLRVDIRPPGLSFSIDQDNIDTTLTMNSDGSIAEELLLSVSSSTPWSLLKTTWDYGDGSAPEIVHWYPNSRHKFTRVGTFIVRAEGRDTAGVLIGRDSITVSIRMPEFAFSSIQFSKGISVFLAVDSAHPLFSDTLFRNPFATKLICKNDSVSTAQFQPNGFTVTLDSTDDQYDFHSIHERVTGEFTSDLRKVQTLTVTVNDTGRINRLNPGQCGLHYTLSIKDLDLLAVTTNKLVYRSRSTTVSDFLSSVEFRASNQKNTPGGVLREERTESSFPPEAKLEPYALVIFDR